VKKCKKNIRYSLDHRSSGPSVNIPHYGNTSHTEHDPQMPPLAETAFKSYDLQPPPYNPSYDSTSNTEYPSPGYPPPEYPSVQNDGNFSSFDDAPPDYYSVIQS